MYKDYRYINAGQNEFYRWGKKAQEKVEKCLIPNEQGYYSIIADGGKYWTIGTSTGKFGEFAKFGDAFLSVNKAGYVWAKKGTDKEQIFLNLANGLLKDMRTKKLEGVEDDD